MPEFYQQPTLSPEFKTELRKFRNFKYFDNTHVLALTQLIIIESIRDTTFDYYMNYQAKASEVCAFHGTIDFFLYQKYDESSRGAPFIPILFPIEKDSNITSTTNENYSGA
jgi:hypothetical protein